MLVKAAAGPVLSGFSIWFGQYNPYSTGLIHWHWDNGTIAQ